MSDVVDSENENTYEPVLINIKTLKKYREKHGAEQAQGYLDALIHMSGNIEGLFTYVHPRWEIEVDASPSRVRTGLKNFKNEIDYLIKLVEKSAKISNQEASSNLESNKLNM